mgnify:CR=1 FL=1
MNAFNGHLPLHTPIRDAIERHCALTKTELTEEDLRMIGREASDVLRKRVRS